jgi:PAS domain S-box-containing protein
MLASALFLAAIAYLVSFRDARLALRVAEGTRQLSTELQRRTTIEAELRAAQSRYQTLVEVNPDAVLVNFKKRIVYANKAAARLLGAASPEDLLGRSPFDVVEPARKAEVEQRYERALATGQPNPPSIQRRDASRRFGCLCRDHRSAAALGRRYGGPGHYARHYRAARR